MNEFEALEIVNLLKDVDFTEEVRMASTLGHIRLNQLTLLDKALDVLVKTYVE